MDLGFSGIDLIEKSLLFILHQIPVLPVNYLLS